MLQKTSLNREEIIYENIHMYICIWERNKLNPKYEKQVLEEDLGNKLRIRNRNRMTNK